MKFARLARHSLRTMGRYKLRTSFMMLGSLIGIAAVTFVVSVGQAAEQKTLQTIGRIVGDSGVVIEASGGDIGGPRGIATRLKVDDIAAVSKEVPGVEAWDVVKKIKPTIRSGNSAEPASVLGESEQWQEVWNRRVSRGDSFDETAVKSLARVAIIGQTVATQLYGNDDPIGQDIQIGSVPFKVIGILEVWGIDPHGMDRDNEIVVPISTLLRRLANEDTISEGKLVMSDPSRADTIEPEVRALLRERHHLAAEQPDDFYIVTPAQTRGWVTQIRRVLFFYLPLIAASVLLVAAIVSATLMLANVNGRIAEIGLRRAVGARPEDIRLQFLLETALTILVGGVIGIALGYVLAFMWANRLHLGSLNPVEAALLGIGTACVVGAIAGILPAIRAARLRPAEALR